MERRLEALPGRFAIWRLPPDAPLPQVMPTAEWVFVARTPDEVSLLLPAQVSPPADAQPGPGQWRAWRVAGALDFALVGVLADLTHALAQAGIPLLAVSTFDTDYVFVPAPQAAAAVRAWRAAGWVVPPALGDSTT